MSGKLDQSLDQILKDRRAPPRRSTRRSTRPAKSAAATSAGVTKNSRAAKAAPKKAVPTGPSNIGPSKIIVSNLPTDVTETHIKEYFVSTIGRVNKVLLTYGPNGQSRGVATVVFAEGKAAAEAAKLLDGTKVDGRPMKVEVVVTAKDAPVAAPIKALADRVSQPKKQDNNAAKSAAAKTNGKTNSKKTARGRTAGRGKPKKTAQELDAEMTDYFGGETNGVEGNVAAQPVATGGDAMEEVIL